jgi:DNA-binding LacI/PurR family transcriptional regulator
MQKRDRVKRNITSSDVAKEAGVSRATVSYILNNTEGKRISEETRLKVLEAAKRLGYHLDYNARALKTNRSMSIAVVSRRSIEEPRFTKVLGGIKKVLSKERYSILICSDEKDLNGYPEYYSLYRSKKIDGVIFVSYQEQLEDEKATQNYNNLIKEGIPCVFADYHLDVPMINSVDINYFHGAYIAASYVIQKGHKDIAFLVPDSGTIQERQRLDGIKKAIEEAENVQLHMYNVGRHSETIEENIVKVLEDRKKFTALISAWGWLSAKVLYYANKLNIAVPKELSVISLAGEDAAEYTYPRLTTCELPLQEMGIKSTQILLETLDNGALPVNMKLPCSLKIRESI